LKQPIFFFFINFVDSRDDGCSYYFALIISLHILTRALFAVVTSASYFPHHQAAPACYTYSALPSAAGTPMSLQNAAAAYAAAAGPTVNQAATASAGEGRLQ
jgi:hypothetical protein